MNKRNCPVCASNESVIIMRFSSEVLSEVNPTYRLEEFRKAIKGKEELLTYSKCEKCKMVYCENMWDDITLSAIYGKVIDHVKSKDKIQSVAKRIFLTRRWINILHVLKLLGRNKLEDLKIIDYGCGWGDFLDVVRGFGVNVMGYDPDSKKLELPKQHGHKIAKDIDELKSFGPVDVLVMNSVLEHLIDVTFHLNLTKQLLKQGGLFVFSVMDYRPRYIKKNIRRLRNNLPALTKNLNPVEHVNVYNYKAVMTTLKRYNFDFISTSHVLYLTNFLMISNIALISFFNWIEWLSTKFIPATSITAYALNKK